MSFPVSLTVEYNQPSIEVMLVTREGDLTALDARVTAIENVGVGGGTGTVTGPASSTTDALARYSDTSGTLLKNSVATLSDSGALSTPQVNATTSVAIGTVPNVSTVSASQVVGSRAVEMPDGAGTVALTSNVDGSPSSISSKVKAGEVLGVAGKAVYVSGNSGGNKIVSLASNTSEATSSATFGITRTAMGAINAEGYVVTHGLVTGLSIATSGVSVGDSVWLGVSGDLLFGSKPAWPAHKVYLGRVSQMSSTFVTSITVAVVNGFELDEVHDVYIPSTPVANSFLVHDSVKWTNKTATEAKSAIGLGNVNNTSDASKPVSSAMQDALDLKANVSHVHAQVDIDNGSHVTSLTASHSANTDFSFNGDGGTVATQEWTEGRVSELAWRSGEVSSTADPTASDSSSSVPSYSVGSMWYNTAGNYGESALWICKDSSAGMAVWKEVLTTNSLLSASNVTGILTAPRGGIGLDISSGSVPVGSSIRKLNSSQFEWYTPSAGGGAPGGGANSIQYNDGFGNFAGSSTSSIDTSTGAIVHTKTGLGTTTTFGITLANTTAAAVNAQQVSPALYFRGNGWKTNATAASVEAGIRVHVSPSQGSANPSASLLFVGMIGGVASSNVASINSDGGISAWSISCYDLVTPQSRATLTNNGNFLGYYNSYFALSNSSGAAASGTVDLIWRRKGQFVGNNWVSGAADSATPASQTLSVQNGSGANIAGVDRYIVGCQGTGTGVGGEIVFATAPPGTSGSTQNALVNRFTVKHLGACRFHPLSDAPSTALAGDVYYDSTVNKLRCYNGTIWNDLF